tara:strand:+ start:1497 stop:1661 length:165 start_codon:yes stop_codon:yes gene_type:complete
MTVVNCPKCKSRYAKIVTIEKKGILMLKTRSWIICNDCGYDRESSDFKKELLVR